MREEVYKPTAKPIALAHLDAFCDLTALLADITDAIQASVNNEELYGVIYRFLPQLIEVNDCQIYKVDGDHSYTYIPNPLASPRPSALPVAVESLIHTAIIEKKIVACNEADSPNQTETSTTAEDQATYWWVTPFFSRTSPKAPS